VGLLVLAAFAGALRRAAPAASRLRGAALGAAASAWAGLTVFLFCPAGAHRHLLVGHVRDETIANENARSGRWSRLDEILARHRRRRSRALAVLLMWAVFGGTLLAM
jgi:hypothetical protein